MKENHIIHHQQYQKILNLIESRQGTVFPESHGDIILNAINERADVLQISPDYYFSVLCTEPEELKIFFNLISINETYFFREEKHFNILKDSILPVIREKKETVNLWSVTCSTGEEALSLAMITEEFYNIEKNKNFRVYATDINTNSLSVLKSGKYAKNSFRKDGSSFSGLFQKYGYNEDNFWTAGQEIMGKIEIIPCNLLQNNIDFIPDESINIAFFRNTMIYMKQEQKIKGLIAITKKIIPGGFIFLSSSEIPTVSHPELIIIEKNGIYYFQKNKNQEAIEKTEAMSGSEQKNNLQNSGPVIPVSTRDSISLDKIIELCCQYGHKDKAENEQKQNTDRNLEISKQILRSVSIISHNEFEKAKKLLWKIEDEISQNHITQYLLGLIEILGGNSRKAAIYFEKSISLNGLLWLPHFYLAGVLKDIKPQKALMEYSICRDLIVQAGKSRQNFLKYNFLIENFDEMYFYKMCEKWINKLSLQR